MGLLADSALSTIELIKLTNGKDNAQGAIPHYP